MNCILHTSALSRRKFFVFHSSKETCSDTWEFSSKDTQTSSFLSYLSASRREPWKWDSYHWAACGKAQYISDVIRDRDKELWGKITDTQCLKDLLPSKLTDRSLHQRGHDYILPRIRTEHFKRCVFLTLFSFMFVRKFVFVEIISLLLHCKLARVPASVWIKLSIKIFNSIHSIFYKNLSYRTFSLKFAKISRTVLRTRRKIYFSLLLLCKIQKNWMT